MDRTPVMESLESRQLMSVAVGLGVYRSVPVKGHAVVKKPVAKKPAAKVSASTGRPTTTSGFISGTVYYDVNQNGLFDPLIDLVNGGGKVYADLNNNGVLDTNEPNVTVSLAGTYSFGGLQKGTYTIREIPPVGFAEIAPAARAYRISLGAGESLPDRNFFNTPAVTITGNVFSDTNVDGIHESGEPGIPGQTLFDDLNNNGVLDAGEPTAISDSRGGYTLTGLPPGVIHVRLLIPNNFRAVSPGGGVLSTQVASGTTLVFDFGEVRIF
jgi:hypothetical protein